MLIHPRVSNEYDRLTTVVVGIARQMGKEPTIEECYDARSRESVELGTYPSEEDCRAQMSALVQTLENLGVQVLRPEALSSLNQVFARDIAFVIDDQLILPNVIEDREDEALAIDKITGAVPSSNIIMMPSGCFAEGGDVLVHNDYVFVGVSNDEDFEAYQTARTNFAGFDYLQDEFPGFEFKGFELLKSDTDPRTGTLHLDCAFQAVGCGALIAPHLFKNQEDASWLMDHFGKENTFVCSEDEAYELTTNVFSVGPNDVIICETFERLHKWLVSKGMNVHTVPYYEIVKMGGLLRCSTMPLERES